MNNNTTYVSDMPVEVKPRRMSFPFKRVEKRFFFDDNPVKSAYMAAMSSTFPAGEAEFIESVRLYRDKVTDEKLQQQIRGFIGQEGHHSHQHMQMNIQLKELGFDAPRLERHLEKDIKKLREKRSPRARLALTVGMEHITAIMAAHTLENPEDFNSVDETIRELLLWHAVEEIEHKAVAFDVFMSCDGDRKLLHKALKAAVMLFSIRIGCYMIGLLWWSRTLPRWRHIKDFYSYMFGKKGLVRAIRQPYKDYFEDNFHPWNHQNQALVDTWKENYYKAEHDRGSEQFVSEAA